MKHGVDVSWSLEQIMDLRKDMKDYEAKSFLLRNEQLIADRISELGLDVIQDILNEEAANGTDIETGDF